MTITLQELDSKLFNCADVLRGSIDSGRYKDFVLPLVFYATIDGWYTQELNNKAQDKENCNYNLDYRINQLNTVKSEQMTNSSTPKSKP